MRNEVLLNRILLVIIGVLIALFFIGTIFGVANKKDKTPEVLISQGKAVNLAAPANTDVVEYYQLQTIRIITAVDEKIKDDTGCAFVISPWLAYPMGDTVFYEEIARKQGAIKAIFRQYFAEKTQAQILGLGEESINKELMQKINEQLSLGQIQSIFFTDFIFLQ